MWILGYAVAGIVTAAIFGDPEDPVDGLVFAGFVAFGWPVILMEHGLGASARWLRRFGKRIAR